MAQLSKRKLSKKLGKSASFLSSMKLSAREKYDYIASFDDDLEISIDRYQDHVRAILNKLLRFYYSLGASKFYDLIMESGVYKDRKAAALSMNTLLFTNRNDYLGLNIKTIKRLDSLNKSLIERRL